ncbi:Ubiquitin carboxyl-terminal hydrolase 40 [Galemys pyrenaicus]|uniref:Ubiquitin carboxyl-terminal hydrolase 40 n=1 Tax=Galemys pyrenaicus TaxID=202257 RepID=A0A8J6AQ92_GALPY|nr:Ubiquitin carboxyl-terminal hydrolase 40 [Galemys pyrenaicus]
MFGNLFEEDYSSVSNNQYGKGKKLKTKALEPPAPREFTNLSGIRNQGGTCYLNSLLQTLHFTPEFRGMLPYMHLISDVYPHLYRQEIFMLPKGKAQSSPQKGGRTSQVRIIPLQLQRLFAQLLLLDQEAASTADLTDSFGWTNNEEMRQHDVQELNRILFSALETSLVGTSGHDLINRLYHGTIVNQIVCKECQNVSEKQEDFLDLTVAVKNVSGLEDALWNMYVEEELFDSDNLYHCGTCDKLVKAAKSAKLRKLPPFLTVSLLRFNFDFVKCERYKETSCYSFPLQINLKPFCEQSELDDVDYIYDLFSVIIHRGGCYGGHYHVYIRDVDHLGNWQFQEEKSEPDENLKDTQKEEETDDPLMIVKAILLQEESNLILVDQLGQKLLKKIGISWNKKYRKQYGPLRKFLQLHSQVFLLSSDENTVSLLKTGSPQAESDGQRHSQQAFKTPASESRRASDQTPCSHWFDINDSKVQPIKEKDIEQQFQGKESAYMLFYRKSQLQRPPEAQGNPRYRVPCHLLNEMDAANIRLQAKRAEYDSTSNNFELHLHLGPHYHFFNGALHPVVSQTESMWDLTFDKRKTLGDLRQSIFQLLEFWEGDMVLSIAKFVPAGLHVYQTLDGDDLTLCEIEIADGEDIFVWDGVEVGGVQISTGSDCEPLLLNVLRLTTSSDGENCQQLTESSHVFPSNAEVGAVFTALAIPVGVVFINNTESTGEENWAAIPEEDLKKTFREQGVRNGSSVLIQESSNDDSSLLPKQVNWITSMNEIDWLQVKNMCQLDSEEKQVKISATVSTVSRTANCQVVFDIRIKAIEELKLMKELGCSPTDRVRRQPSPNQRRLIKKTCVRSGSFLLTQVSSPVVLTHVSLFIAEDSCLRPIDRNGKLLCPVPDSCTLKEADLKMGSSLGLCPGKAPTSTQVTAGCRGLLSGRVRDLCPVFGDEHVPGTTVAHSKAGTCVNKRRLSRWRHLEMHSEFRNVDVSAPVSAVKEQRRPTLPAIVRLWSRPRLPDATLKELMIRSGDTLLLIEGKLLPRGFLKVPIWWYQPLGASGHWTGQQDQMHCPPGRGGDWRAASTRGVPSALQAEVPLHYLGDVEISEDATLAELKSQAMTLPSFWDFAIPSPALLRAWTVESKRPSRLLRTNQQQLK